MKLSTALIAITVALAGSSPALAQEAVANTTATAETPAPVELTEKEQAQLEKCRKLTSVQIDQSSKCTKLIEKAGGTIQRTDSATMRRAMGQ